MTGLTDLTWLGRADHGRVAMVDGGIVVEQAGVRLSGPLAVAVVWGRPSVARADRLTELFAGVYDLGRILLALGDALSDWLEPAPRAEMESLTAYVLGASARRWRKTLRPVPVFLLDAWYAANAMLGEPAEPPPVRVTWNELQPSRESLSGGLTARDLQELDDWLTLTQILAARDPDALKRLGFYACGQQLLLAHLAVELGEVGDPELAGLARRTLIRLQSRPTEERWRVPQDIDAPPSTEPVTRERSGFTRDDVRRVLADL